MVFQHVRWFSGGEVEEKGKEEEKKKRHDSSMAGKE